VCSKDKKIKKLEQIIEEQQETTTKLKDEIARLKRQLRLDSVNCNSNRNKPN